MNSQLVLVNAENPVINTINVTNREDKVKAYNALANPTGDISELVNRDFNIVNFHMEHSTAEDDDGDLYDRIKTVILLDDGTAYSTTYKSFAKSLLNYVSVFGMPDEWENHKAPCTVQVVKYQGGLHDGLRLVAK